MWYAATMNAYDVMGTVHVHVTVRRAGESAEDGFTPEFSTGTDVPGVGESDAREWLRDALVALLEVV